jgi:AcrR family transcriptional regulator
VPPYLYDQNGRRVVPPSKGERRELSILEAAENQLAEVGVDGMTVESIATAAGITRAALYRYFRSKNDVLAELVRRTVSALHASIDQLPVEDDESPEELLRVLVGRTEEMWREHGAVMRAALELGPTVESVREAWDSAFGSVTATTAEIAVRAGVPDSDDGLGARAMTFALSQMTERVFYDASRSGADLHASAATILTIWLRALRIAP